MKNLFLFFIIAMTLVSCTTAPRFNQLQTFTSANCRSIYAGSDKLETIDKLNTVTDLYNSQCFKEVIHLGTQLRQYNRDKFYNVTAESLEVFTPDGTLTEYVLESYERAFLSILISLSYLNTKQEQEALVELRMAEQEAQAFIYNHGHDEMIQLLMASLWDRFEPQMARPYWKSLLEGSQSSSDLKKISQARISEIDSKMNARVQWRIYGLGYLPDLDWKMSMMTSDKSYFKILAKTNFPLACYDQEALLVPTETWVQKISHKYDSAYHPMLYAKSLVRFTVGTGYGLLGVTSAAVVGAGGCLVSAKSQARDGCENSLKAAGLIWDATTHLVDYVWKPDMRHWSKIPSAFYISREQKENEVSKCVQSGSIYSMKTMDLL